MYVGESRVMLRSPVDRVIRMHVHFCPPVQQCMTDQRMKLVARERFGERRAFEADVFRSWPLSPRHKNYPDVRIAFNGSFGELDARLPRVNDVSKKHIDFARHQNVQTFFCVRSLAYVVAHGGQQFAD